MNSLHQILTNLFVTDCRLRSPRPSHRVRLLQIPKHTARPPGSALLRFPYYHDFRESCAADNALVRGVGFHPEAVQNADFRQRSFVTNRALYEVRERPSKAYSWQAFML